MAPNNWEEIKKRTKLYAIKCCPNCGQEDLHEYATGILGPRWGCNNCGDFEIRNPSYLSRKELK